MKNNKSYAWLYIILIILIFILGGLCTYTLMNSPLMNKEQNNNNNNNNNNNQDVIYNSCSNCKSGTTIVENGGISESVEKVYDSVVMVKIYKNKKYYGSGSGFVYKRDSKYGYVMTNYHVIEDATSVKIRTASEEEVAGTVLGGDKFLDIAVIRIDVKNVIAVAKIGSTEKLKLGDRVFAIGTPVDEDYFNSVTGGFVSGINRKVPVSVESKYDWIQEVIQIDAAINPGNSGGPLFNFNGEVIGVNSMKLINEQVEGMGFTIKIEDAMKHIDDLENGRSIKRPFIGVSYIDVTETATLRYNGLSVDDSVTEGVVVASVEEGSAAHKAGLQRGDVIVKLNNDKVSQSAFLRYLLYKYNIGDTIKVSYYRDGRVYTTSVTLTEKKS